MTRLALSFLLLFPAAAFAQEAPATPKPPVPPQEAATPAPAEGRESSRRAREIVESLRREVSHRTAEARSIFARGRFDEDLKPKIGAAMDRAIAHVELQQARVESWLARIDAGEPDALHRLEEELEAMAEDAYDDAKAVADVRTRGGETEDNLQRIASEIRSIGTKAEALAEEVDEIADTADQGPEVRVRIGNDRDYGDDGDRVRFGGGVTVEKGESVKDAVAFGGPVTVHGAVEGDAVAFGGDVRVSSTGHVKGDAASFGGRVDVEPGGKVDGEQVSMGAGAISKSFFPRVDTGRRVQRSWPAIMGTRLAWAGVEFLVFFFVGMLVLAAMPERTENVARAIEASPGKAVGFGILLFIALLMVSLLLAVTIVGLLPLALLVLPAAFATITFGYVALALVVGRRLKTGVVPTPLALFAIGAAVVAAMQLLPLVFHILFWLIGACFALGAVVMTRFGAPTDVPPPPAAA